MSLTPRASKRRKLADPANSTPPHPQEPKDLPSASRSVSGNRSTRSKKVDYLKLLKDGAGSTPTKPRTRVGKTELVGEQGEARDEGEGEGEGDAIDGVEEEAEEEQTTSSLATREKRSDRKRRLERGDAEPKDLDGNDGDANHQSAKRRTPSRKRKTVAIAVDESTPMTTVENQGISKRLTPASGATPRRSGRRSGVVNGESLGAPDDGVLASSTTRNAKLNGSSADLGVDSLEQHGRNELGVVELPTQQSLKSRDTSSKRRRRNRTDHFENAEAIEIDPPQDRLPDHSEASDDTDDEQASPPGQSPQPSRHPIASKLATPQPPTIPAQAFKPLRNIALSKLTSRRPIPLQNLSTERTKVHSLLKATVSAGEGNSLLILGARGTGKTALVNDVLSSLSADPALHDNFHVIRLDGLIQTDDKLALREIWRQLGREMELDDGDDEDAEGGGGCGSGGGVQQPGKNYADALTTLLALLSHPDEHSRDEQSQPQSAAAVVQQPTLPNDLGHDSDNNNNDTTTTTTTTPKSLIFLLSSFSHFASRPRQTLLYNLFDVAQARKAPIAVLGLSSRMDVADMLEKRVKSRFSHRFVFVPQARSWNGFLGVLRAGVRVEVGEWSSSGGEDGDDEEAREQARQAWNAAAEGLLSNDSSSSSSSSTPTSLLLPTLKRIYHTTKSIPAALSALYLPIYHLVPPTSPIPTLSLSASPSKSKSTPPRSFSFSPHSTSNLLQPPLSTPLHSLPRLQPLPLSLLISALRLPHLTSSPTTINFPLAYAEYLRLASAARLAGSMHSSSAVGGVVGGRIWSKAVAWGAWGVLLREGLLLRVENGNGGVGGGGGTRGRGSRGMGNGAGENREKAMVRPEVALSEVEGAIVRCGKGRGSMDPVLRRWCREL